LKKKGIKKPKKWKISLSEMFQKFNFAIAQSSLRCIRSFLFWNWNLFLLKLIINS
jgi:hypothetical protein